MGRDRRLKGQKRLHGQREPALDVGLQPHPRERAKPTRAMTPLNCSASVSPAVGRVWAHGAAHPRGRKPGQLRACAILKTEHFSFIRSHIPLHPGPAETGQRGHMAPTCPAAVFRGQRWDPRVLLPQGGSPGHMPPHSPPRASLQGSEGAPPKSSIPRHRQPGTPHPQTGPGLVSFGC